MKNTKIKLQNYLNYVFQFGTVRFDNGGDG